MPRKYSIPLLSLYNGPSALPHAVEALQHLQIPLVRARFLPVIGYAADPEVIPYYRHTPQNEDYRGNVENLSFCLHVNIREDHRLASFLPIVATGLAPAAEVAKWQKDKLSASEGYRQLYPRLDEVQQDWTNLETPVERMARQICTLFPELRESRAPLIKPSDRILVAFQNALEPRLRAGAFSEFAEIPDDVPDAIVVEIVQLFVTLGLVAVATCDMLGGFRYNVPIEGRVRDIDLSVTPESDVDNIALHVSQWLEAYPHRPIARSVYDEPDPREKEEWAAVFVQHPERDNIFELAPKLRTPEDPAIQNLSRRIQRQYEAGRTEELTAEEMLSLAQIYLPEYIPHYPNQFAQSGGINLEGILIIMMERWIDQGSFLGVETHEWELFEPTQRIALMALLLQRRSCTDLCGLFGIVVQKLIDPSIEVWIDEYKFMPIRLGGPLAQPGITMALGGVSAIHRPEVLIKIPKDHTDLEQSMTIESQIDVLARLFLPFHIPFRAIWQLDWPVLGKSAYLHTPGKANPAGALARLNAL